MKRHVWLFAISLLLAFPAAAQVTRGYASIDVNLRAGPDIGYPIVDLIPTGMPLYVHGCTADWSWCDVSIYDYNERGWVPGDYINYPYQRRWVSAYDYGAIIGIPVVTFVIGDYWSHHYRYRGFYRDRDYWYDHRFAYHRAPRFYGERRHHDRYDHDRYDHDRHDRHRGHHDDRPRLSNEVREHAGYGDRDRSGHHRDGDRHRNEGGYRDHRGGDHKPRLSTGVMRASVPRGELERARVYTPRREPVHARNMGPQNRGMARQMRRSAGWQGHQQARRAAPARHSRQDTPHRSHNHASRDERRGHHKHG